MSCDTYLLAGNAIGFAILMAFTLSDFRSADEWPGGRHIPGSALEDCAPALSV